MLPALTVRGAEELKYIKAGQLVDVLAGKIVADQVIVIQGDKIIDVADATDVAILRWPHFFGQLNPIL